MQLLLAVSIFRESTQYADVITSQVDRSMPRIVAVVVGGRSLWSVQLLPKHSIYFKGECVPKDELCDDVKYELPSVGGPVLEREKDGACITQRPPLAYLPHQHGQCTDYSPSKNLFLHHLCAKVSKQGPSAGSVAVKGVDELIQ